MTVIHTIEEATFVELGTRMLALLEAKLAESPGDHGRKNASAREFALSRTHLEDALSRWNVGFYRARGMSMHPDPDRLP